VYLAPNFDIDTSTNVAGLTALKGGAPALTDLIYIYNAALVTIEANMSILLISQGETSAGAAPAGQKRGDLQINAGVTVTFAGAAVATNSGIKMNPAGAAAESLNCLLNIFGVAPNMVTLTNSVGAVNAANKWTIQNEYGTPYIEWTNLLYAYQYVISLNCRSTRMNGAFAYIQNCTFNGMAGAVQGTNISINHSGQCRPIYARNNTINAQDISQILVGSDGGNWVVGTSLIDVSGYRFIVTGAGVLVRPLQVGFLVGNPAYGGECILSTISDIRAGLPRFVRPRR
jgi:hypothetical protein